MISSQLNSESHVYFEVHTPTRTHAHTHTHEYICIRILYIPVQSLLYWSSIDLRITEGAFHQITIAIEFIHGNSHKKGSMHARQRVRCTFYKLCYTISWTKSLQF